MKNVIQTKHNLDFEACPWPIDPSVMLYRVGTVTGQWMITDKCVIIISMLNERPGNGHLDDVFEWFEHAATRDAKPLVIAAVMNQRFKKHCINKRGFIPTGTDDCVKFF